MPMYDRYGQPIGVKQWREHWHKPGYRRVLRTVFRYRSSIGIEHVVVIDTSWMGVDRSLGNEETPHIFETTVFGGKNDGHISTHPNLKEAVVAHRSVVNACEQYLQIEDEDELTDES